MMEWLQSLRCRWRGHDWRTVLLWSGGREHFVCWRCGRCGEHLERIVITEVPHAD